MLTLQPDNDFGSYLDNILNKFDAFDYWEYNTIHKRPTKARNLSLAYLTVNIGTLSARFEEHPLQKAIQIKHYMSLKSDKEKEKRRKKWSQLMSIGVGIDLKKNPNAKKVLTRRDSSLRNQRDSRKNL